MEFEKACSLCYDFFQKNDKPGIAAIWESPDAWIFSGADETEGITDYDIPPIIIYKKNGTSHFMSFADEEDVKIYDESTETKVPEEYKAKY